MAENMSKKKRICKLRGPMPEETKAKIKAKAKANWQNPSYKAAFSAGYDQVKGSLKERIKAAGNVSERTKQALSTPEVRAKMSAGQVKAWASDLERHEAAAKRLKNEWTENGAERSAVIREVLSSKENKERASRHATELWSKPEHQELMSKKMTELWEDKAYREKIHPHIYTSETITKRQDFISDLEAGLGSVSSLCDKYNFAHSTMFLFLRANGLQHLIDESAAISGPQAEIAAYISSLGFEVESNTRKIIAPKEIDIYVPACKLGIEFNGLFWHSSANKKYERKKHVQKYYACKAAEIKLLAIFEDEWDNKQDVVKAMIRHRLGCTVGLVKLHARNLEVCDMSPSECKAFHDTSHLDGGLLLSGKGLKIDGNIVAAASFRPYNGSKYENAVEVARFSILPDHSISGALGKLLSHLKDKIVVSYSNNRVGDGNLYPNLGFVEDTASFAPSYWYTDLSTRVFRTKCQKVEHDLYKTEAEQAINGIFSQRLFGDDRPLFRVDDYGHKRWVRLLKP